MRRRFIGCKRHKASCRRHRHKPKTLPTGTCRRVRRPPRLHLYPRRSLAVVETNRIHRLKRLPTDSSRRVRRPRQLHLYLRRCLRAARLAQHRQLRRALFTRPSRLSSSHLSTGRCFTSRILPWQISQLPARLEKTIFRYQYRRRSGRLRWINQHHHQRETHRHRSHLLHPARRQHRQVHQLQQVQKQQRSPSGKGNGISQQRRTSQSSPSILWPRNNPNRPSSRTCSRSGRGRSVCSGGKNLWKESLKNV